MTSFSFNTIKTALFLSILSSVLLALGYLIGGYSGVTVAFAIALVTNGVSYFYSDQIVLKMYKAQPLDKNEYGWIYDMVAELTKTMGLPMPKLWMIEDATANAFATGRNPDNASVAFTRRILQILNRQELRGVVAHELSHVKNRDILIGTVAATVATAITYTAYMLRWTGGMYTSGNDNQRRGNALFLLVASIVMPVAATLLQLAVSRSREYGADETGGLACKDPLSLASALQKLQMDSNRAPQNSAQDTHAATDSLFIVRPLSGSTLNDLFATHPPIADRIKRLEQLQKQIHE